MMMIRILFVLLTGFMPFFTYAQIQTNESTVSSPDTLKSFLVRKHPPYLYSVRLNHRETGIGNKILRGILYATKYNIAIGVCLFIAPEYVNKWNKKEKFRIESIEKQYIKSFTSLPVFDRDLWIVNYIGHPYTGSYFYNILRSQDVSAWHSALFCIGNSCLWEYGWEAGMEQPSIQDLIVTPLAGILFGELSHIATIKMSKNGFSWYEIVIVLLINPAFAFNNGFRFERPVKL